MSTAVRRDPSPTKGAFTCFPRSQHTYTRYRGGAGGGYNYDDDYYGGGGEEDPYYDDGGGWGDDAGRRDGGGGGRRYDPYDDRRAPRRGRGSGGGGGFDLTGTITNGNKSECGGLFFYVMVAYRTDKKKKGDG